jgi:hypothetical protein
MKKYVPEILAVLSLCSAVLVLVLEQLTSACPIFFHFEEIHSHEALASFLIVGGVALIIGKYLGKLLG